MIAAIVLDGLFTIDLLFSILSPLNEPELDPEDQFVKCQQVSREM